VCWLAQQAAEKALKGALASQAIPFPFRHDLDALRNLLPDGWEVKRQHPDLAELTEWAVEARYPGDWPDATVEAARRAAVQAPRRFLKDTHFHGAEADVGKTDTGRPMLPSIHGLVERT
jgi:HEPN domain-containing protein